MTVSTRDRLHNSSFFFKSTHPLSHWLCIVHQQWWEDTKNKVIPTHLHLHQHPSERQNLDLAKWILTADQINFYLLQWIAQINQVICIWKSTIFLCSKKKTVLSSIYSHYKFFSSIISTIWFYSIKIFGVLKPICF